MAQGTLKKLGNKKKAPSGGSQKKTAVKAKTNKRKGGYKIENAHVATTKAINKKNERIIAAKATTAGSQFYLKDIATKGKNESQRQTAVRDKKQLSKTNQKISSRLKDQIQKLKSTSSNGMKNNNKKKK
jgi:hypothetical protein